MAFHCIKCKNEIDKSYKACPHCGEPITDFLRTYAETPIDGKYQITDRLGAGGMGEVYKVQHTFLGATRVIKVIRPQISESKDAHERFLREARLATKIQHPNVATLHDFSSLPDGSHYMVWEFIDGENVAQRIRTRGTLQPRYAVRVIIQALWGLEAIHRAGIVHRDISPENIMITREQYGEERVKVIDLGVAKIDDPAAENATRVGVFVGKLRYASPEHLGFLNEGERIDGRADLYSLAMVLYEMLTGRPPFEATSPHEYILLHSKATAFRPLDLPPDLPGGAELQAVMARALDHDRNKRYANAREFAQALEKVERSLPDPVSTPTMNMQAPPVFQADTFNQPTQRSGVVDPSTQGTIRTPLPGETVRTGVAGPTIQTPLPGRTVNVGMPSQPAPPAYVPAQPTMVVAQPSQGGGKAILIIGLIILIAGGAIAFLLLRRNDNAELPGNVAQQTTTAPGLQASATTTNAATPTSANVDVVTTTPTVTSTQIAEESPTLSATTATRPDLVPQPTAVPTATVGRPTARPQPPIERPRDDDNPQPVPQPPIRDPRPEPVPAPVNVRSFIDGDTGDPDVNEELIENLHRQLNGVSRVSIRGSGDMHAQLIQRFRNALPTIAIVDDADTVINFRGTLETVNRGKKRRSADATIVKNGRVIFKYELPPEEFRVGDTPAEAFSRVLNEAFGTGP
jgi:eukaryotic-like serine/threonine-protein kinase